MAAGKQGETSLKIRAAVDNILFDVSQGYVQGSNGIACTHVVVKSRKHWDQYVGLVQDDVMRDEALDHQSCAVRTMVGETVSSTSTFQSASSQLAARGLDSPSWCGLKCRTWLFSGDESQARVFHQASYANAVSYVWRCRCRMSPNAAMQGDEAAPKKRSFRRFQFRGVDLEKLLELPLDDLLDHFHARARRKCASHAAVVGLHCLTASTC